MSLSIKTFCAGPLENNIILVIDQSTLKGMLIDPSFEAELALDHIQAHNLVVEYILFTHGHFDHFAGLSYALSRLSPLPKIGLHSADLALWKDGGGSKHFRMPIEIPGDPDFLLDKNNEMELGDSKFEIRHTPGHSPGSVIFYFPGIASAVVGDLIFHRGIGRTDLDGGNFNALVNSINTQIFTLPPETILIPGHGPETTVLIEMQENPYVGLHSDFGKGSGKQID